MMIAPSLDLPPLISPPCSYDDEKDDLTPSPPAPKSSHPMRRLHSTLTSYIASYPFNPIIFVALALITSIPMCIAMATTMYANGGPLK